MVALIANKAIDSRKRSSRARLVCKLDIENALMAMWIEISPC